MDPLLPRYRRPSTFAGVLDDSFHLFRQAWLPLLLVMSIAAIMTLILRSIQGLLGGTTFPATAFVPTPNSAAPFSGVPPSALVRFGLLTLLFTILSFVVTLPSVLAVVTLTNGMMRGTRASVANAWASYVWAFRKLGYAFASSAIALFAILGLSIVSVALWTIGLFVIGPLIALIGLIVWLVNRRARRPWLKWLIVLAAPWGLVFYFAYKWSLATPAIVLEEARPVAALRRSSRLAKGDWFRVSGIVTVLAIVVGLLQAIPGFLVTIPLTVARLGTIVRNGPAAAAQPDLAATILSSAASSLGLMLFGALPVIGLTVLFIDLRNRHEGADLAERIDALEAPDPDGRLLFDPTSPALG